MIDLNNVKVKVEYGTTLAIFTAFNRFGILRNMKQPLGILRMVLYFVISPVMIGWAFIDGHLEQTWLYCLILAILSLWHAANWCYVWFFRISKEYETKYGQGVPKETYLFAPEGFVNMTLTHDMSSNFETLYSICQEVYETGDALYLFKTKTSAYVIPKAAITLGSIEELRILLQQAYGKHYHIVK